MEVFGKRPWSWISAEKWDVAVWSFEATDKSIFLFLWVHMMVRNTFNAVVANLLVLLLQQQQSTLIFVSFGNAYKMWNCYCLRQGGYIFTLFVCLFVSSITQKLIAQNSVESWHVDHRRTFTCGSVAKPVGMARLTKAAPNPSKKKYKAKNNFIPFTTLTLQIKLHSELQWRRNALNVLRCYKSTDLTPLVLM